MKDDKSGVMRRQIRVEKPAKDDKLGKTPSKDDKLGNKRKSIIEVFGQGLTKQISG